LICLQWILGKEGGFTKVREYNAVTIDPIIPVDNDPEIEKHRKNKEREIKSKKEEIERLKQRQLNEEEEKKKLEKMSSELKSKP
jgi:membrane protein involved in colicin uptake